MIPSDSYPQAWRVLMITLPETVSDFLVEMIDAEWLVASWHIWPETVKRPYQEIGISLMECYSQIGHTRLVGNIPCSPGLMDLVLRVFKTRPALVLVDPRDYIAHRYLRLKSDNPHAFQNEKVNGKPLTERRDAISDMIKGITDVYAEFTGWMDREEVLVVRFEDFFKSPLMVIKKIYNHNNWAFREINEKILFERIRKRLDESAPDITPGNWRNIFKARHLTLFNKQKGIEELMEKLGYPMEEEL